MLKTIRDNQHLNHLELSDQFIDAAIKTTHIEISDVSLSCLDSYTLSKIISSSKILIVLHQYRTRRS